MPGYAVSQVSSEEGVPLAAFAALLALADFSTPVHLPPECGALADAVRFHTGAPVTDDPAQAAFAYIHDAASLPPLASFSTGEPETPQDAAMLFIRVDSLTEEAWALRLVRNLPSRRHAVDVFAERAIGIWELRFLSGS